MTDSRHGPNHFATTRWSLVLSACNKTSPASAAALESLCQTYWYPIYVLVRRKGYSGPDAQDLTQSFFQRLLEKDYIQSAERKKGRFRTFLIVAVKHFLLNEWDKMQTQKRGGGHLHVSIDAELAETRYRDESLKAVPAEMVFERRWALTLLERTISRLREEYEKSGRGAEFERLKTYLTAERGKVSYREIATALQMTEGASRVALHRLRKRFRQFFRDEIAGTVSSPDEVEEEVRYVVSVLAR